LEGGFGGVRGGNGEDVEEEAEAAAAPKTYSYVEIRRKMI
jgi:hypothetical protein